MTSDIDGLNGPTSITLNHAYFVRNRNMHKSWPDLSGKGIKVFVARFRFKPQGE